MKSKLLILPLGIALLSLGSCGDKGPVDESKTPNTNGSSNTGNSNGTVDQNTSNDQKTDTATDQDNESKTDQENTDDDYKVPPNSSIVGTSCSADDTYSCDGDTLLGCLYGFWVSVNCNEGEFCRTNQSTGLSSCVQNCVEGAAEINSCAKNESYSTIYEQDVYVQSSTNCLKATDGKFYNFTTTTICDAGCSGDVCKLIDDDLNTECSVTKYQQHCSQEGYLIYCDSDSEVVVFGSCDQGYLCKTRESDNKSDCVAQCTESDSQTQKCDYAVMVGDGWSMEAEALITMTCSKATDNNKYWFEDEPEFCESCSNGVCEPLDYGN